MRALNLICAKTICLTSYLLTILYEIGDTLVKRFPFAVVNNENN